MGKIKDNFSGFEEPNTSPIPNKLIDELMWDLSPLELKLLLLLFRYQAASELKAMPWSILGKSFLGMGVSTSELNTAINDLKKKKTIREAKDGSGGKIYFLNLGRITAPSVAKEEKPSPMSDIAARLRSDLTHDLEGIEKAKPIKKGTGKEQPPEPKEKATLPDLPEKVAEKGKTTWEAILAEVSKILDAFTFNQWLKPTRYFGFREGFHLIEVPSASFYRWFEEEYKDTLSEIAKKVDPNFRYRFISKEETSRLKDEL
jgi:hypothetical protein